MDDDWIKPGGKWVDPRGKGWMQKNPELAYMARRQAASEGNKTAIWDERREDYIDIHGREPPKKKWQWSY